jgi:hypothetical protein
MKMKMGITKTICSYFSSTLSGAQYADFWNNNFAIITVSDKKPLRHL